MHREIECLFDGEKVLSSEITTNFVNPDKKMILLVTWGFGRVMFGFGGGSGGGNGSCGKGTW